MYFDAIRLGKDQYRATMTAILLTLTLTRGVGYFSIGEFNWDVLVITAFLFPSMALGIFIGNRFHHGMSELIFRRTVSGALYQELLDRASAHGVKGRITVTPQPAAARELSSPNRV
jgi:hypothetical protein